MDHNLDCNQNKNTYSPGPGKIDDTTFGCTVCWKMMEGIESCKI